MWESLNHHTVPYLELAVRAGIVYLAILLLLRLGGKRQLSQLSPTEFVSILLISNAVQNSMNGGDNSLTGGLVLAIVLVSLSVGLSILTFRNRLFRHIFEGTPTLLVHKGEIVKKNLSQERMTSEELRSMLRRQGIHSLQEIHAAVLEPDGTLSVIRMAEKSPDFGY